MIYILTYMKLTHITYSFHDESYSEIKNQQLYYFIMTFATLYERKRDI